MQVLRIRDMTEGNSLAFDLEDVLEVIEAWGKGLTWRLQCLDGRGNSLFSEPFRAAATGEGVEVGWDELKQFAYGMTQTYDGIFFGAVDLRQIPDGEISEAAWSDGDIVIEAFDSSYWQIFAREPGVLAALAERFTDTVLIEIEC